MMRSRRYPDREAPDDSDGRHDITSVLRPIDEPSAEAVISTNAQIQGLAKQFKLNESDSKRLTALVEAPRINILTDLPATSDAFGIAPFVRTLSDIVLADSTQTPLAVAVDGEWGCGKTSVMRMLEAQARLVGIPCVWLNAWSLENPEHLISELGAGIREELKRLETIQGKLKSFLSAASAAIGNMLLNSAGVSMKLSTDFSKALKERDSVIEDLVSVVTARQSFDQLVTVLLDAHKASQRPVSTKTSPSDPAGASRLIVFVDDIDRALPEQIITTLKTLKLILENPRCVFVLGMDTEIVASAIETHYSVFSGKDEISKRRPNEMKYSDNFGRNYLEKLIQIQLKLPRLTRSAALQYLEELQVAPAIIEIVRWSPDSETLNPRRLKRYLNWLSVTLQLIVSSPLPPGMTNLKTLKTLFLRRFYPRLYAEIMDLDGPSYEVVSEAIRSNRICSEDDIEDFDHYVSEFANEDDLHQFEDFIPTAPFLNSIVTDTDAILNQIRANSFHVILQSVPEDKKISVMDAVRGIKIELSVAEARDLVERTPSTILEGVSSADALDAQRKLAEAGAKVFLETISEKTDITVK